jgi:hypothetical protein
MTEDGLIEYLNSRSEKAYNILNEIKIIIEHHLKDGMDLDLLWQEKRVELEKFDTMISLIKKIVT